MRIFFAIAITLTILAAAHPWAYAAPLFGDLPQEHWARDAVANIAAKGLVEGYPDGTFKGDRATTRYELAMVVARFLAKNDQEHAAFATRADLETVHSLVKNLRDELDALGVRVTNLEEDMRKVDLRVAEKERITFEGDFSAKMVSIGIKNTGIGGTTWGQDVGNVNALNFNQGLKFGTMDMINGRPLINGMSYTARTRLGVKAKVTDDISAGLRIAGYSALGDPVIGSYWGIPAPYLSNPFAANGFAGGAPESALNTPWNRMTLDNFIVEHHRTGIRVSLGSISETAMDNFILAKVPNPNVCGKSMAKFAETIVPEKEKEEVVTLNYREDEDTYLPFYGAQVKGKAKILSDMDWEVMGSKLPFGANPTAGRNQPATNDITYPLTMSFNGRWHLGDKGTLRFDYLRAVEDNMTAGALIANHGDYFFWTDPLSYANLPTRKQPMRGNTFISQQDQNSYGVSLNYRFDPSNIRTVIAFGTTEYRPNIESGYTVKGNHFRAAAGWTSRQNNLRLNLEYLSTDPYYDPFQLYFQPFGGLLLGGVPPGTPIAFAVVPAYYGGFPGSYAPFAYQLHDSGLYPNNRDGVRFSGEYRFAKSKGSISVRYASLAQHNATTPQQTITGFYSGLQPGFIDPVFHPLNTDGRKIFETPRGYENQLGGGIAYNFGKLRANAQYDVFSFVRSTSFSPLTVTARRDYVDLSYKVLQVGLECPTSRNFTLQGGLEQTSVRGYHPVIATLVYAPAGATLLDLTQSCPYLGFEYKIAENTTWKFRGRLISTVDALNDGVSPESFAGSQYMSDFNVRF
jgi:hypothetical protein